MEPGLGSTGMGACNLKVARFIRSIRLAVKLAMYSTPRGSSTAKSVASPPIGTRIPKVAAWAAPANAAMIPRVVNKNLRNMQDYSYHDFGYISYGDRSVVPGRPFCGQFRRAIQAARRVSAPCVG